jgi:hypothetical protein
MDGHPHGPKGAKAEAKAKAVKEEEDKSQKARLFAYQILQELVDHSTLFSLLEERYGPSIVGGRRF